MIVLTFKRPTRYPYKIAGGKIVEHWANMDAMGILQQLGLMPSPK